MGFSSSKLEKVLGANFPESERYIGFENSSNICYCNSVLQALYYCLPFRKRALDYYAAHSKDHHSSNEDEDSLLTCLLELFHSMHTYKKKTGIIAPRKFVSTLRRENELFNNMMHQDAHEFLNYLLNEVSDNIQKDTGDKTKKTLVQETFQGILTSETKCLNCENITNRDEQFLDLSIDIEQNTSISSCLTKFSSVERLTGTEKFYCENCCSLQEAHKTMKVRKQPETLVVHLKRFKYIEHLQRYKKLSYRVPFPFDLKLSNTIPLEKSEEDCIYDLFAIIIHVGSGPNHGHYISIIKNHGYWLIFDDDSVELIEEFQIHSVFGTTADVLSQNVHVHCGYILLYQKRKDEHQPATFNPNPNVNSHLNENHKK